MGDFADRFGTTKLTIIGAAALAGGYAMFLGIDEHPSLGGLVIPGMLLLGIAFALSFPPLNIQATNGVDDDEQGLASGLLNTSGQVGGAIVLAVVSAVLTSGGATTVDRLAALGDRGVAGAGAGRAWRSRPPGCGHASRWWPSRRTRRSSRRSDRSSVLIRPRAVAYRAGPFVKVGSL